jgi:hypothetical protein
MRASRRRAERISDVLRMKRVFDVLLALGGREYLRE